MLLAPQRLLGQSVKSFLLAGLLLMTPIAAFPEVVTVGRPGLEMHVLSSGDDETILELSLGSFHRMPIDIAGETYYQLRLESEGVCFQKGAPALPLITRSIIIPDRTEVEVQVTESEYRDLRMTVAPSLGLRSNRAMPTSSDYELSAQYDKNEFYPSTIASLGSPYILRDFRAASLRICPFAYNPQTRDLRVYTRVKLRIRSTETDGTNPKNRTTTSHNHDFCPIYATRFLNFPQDRYDAVEERGRLVVICHSDFLGAIQPYIDWKRQKGIQTDLYDVAAIGATPTEIKDFIQDQYNAGDGLTFVQLVGDAAHVPTFITDDIFFGIHGNSDALYSLVEGADTYPDIFVGRFSAETITDLETQVDRTIHYERDIAGGDWLHHGAGLGSVWGEGYGYNGWNGVQSLEVIRQDLIGYHYNLIAQLYEEGEPPFGIIPVEAWEVTEVLHDGIGLLNVDGNADITYLDTGSYTIAHVNALENDYELPVVYLAAPYAGNFQADCFAESWLRATNEATGAPTGAIAVYTCSNALQYAPPQAAMHETVDLLVEDQMNTIGGLMYNGACWMMDLYGAPDEYHTFENFNILGDVSLQMRTEVPEEMEISHQECIDFYATEFFVSAGVEEALVCLSIESAIVASDYTDANGDVTLAFDPLLDETMATLTVTAYNRTTSVEEVPIGCGVGVAESVSRLIDSVGANYPNPAAAEMTVQYSLSENAHAVLEICNLKGERIRTLVSSRAEAGTHRVVWDGRDEQGHRVSSGIYLIRLTSRNTTHTEKAMFIR